MKELSYMDSVLTNPDRCSKALSLIDILCINSSWNLLFMIVKDPRPVEKVQLYARACYFVVNRYYE